MAILNKAIYFNQLTTISYRFHLIWNNNKTDMHSKMIPPFFSKDIWCTFKAGSLNWEKKLLAKTVVFLNQVKKKLPTYDTFLPTTKQAVSKRLMHMQSICNVLIMSVTYFSLSVTDLRFFYIFWKSKVKQFWKTWWMDWEDRYQTGTMETFLAVRETCIAVLWSTPGFKIRKLHSSGLSK